MPVIKKPNRLVAFLPLTVLALALAASAAGNFYLYKQMIGLRNRPTPTAASENAQLLARVGKLMVLPQEEPTIATVTDLSKLQNQPFFAQATSGDKVLIYAQAKKAILYDPNADKIVNVAPLNLTDAAAQPETPAPPQDATVTDDKAGAKTIVPAKKRKTVSEPVNADQTGDGSTDQTGP
jgi:hypothetical protein